MALTNPQADKAARAFNKAYSDENMICNWDTEELITNFLNQDSFFDTNALVINNVFTPSFKAAASAEDKALLIITVLIAQRLIGNPNHISILGRLLDRIRGIS